METTPNRWDEMSWHEKLWAVRYVVAGVVLVFGFYLYGAAVRHPEPVAYVNGSARVQQKHLLPMGKYGGGPPYAVSLLIDGSTVEAQSYDSQLYNGLREGQTVHVRYGRTPAGRIEVTELRP